MRVDLLSREYPPEVYGGAGVHVAELVRALRQTTRCAGARVRHAARRGGGVLVPGARRARRARTPPSRRSASTCRWPRTSAGADIVHSHTWYANGAGHLAKLLHGIPHVVTAHSLEPLRPWKAEQLGGGYRVSSWIEKTAFEARGSVIAVSDGHAPRHPAQPTRRSTREGARSCYNGIDLERWQPDSTSRTWCARSASTPTVRPSSSSAASPGRRASRTCCAPPALLPPEVQLVLVRRRAGHPRDPRRGAAAASRRCRRSAPAWSGSTGCSSQTELRGGAHERHHLRLPVDLRAARHREPRGDGVRHCRSSARRPAASPRSSSTA